MKKNAVRLLALLLALLLLSGCWGKTAKTESPAPVPEATAISKPTPEPTPEPTPAVVIDTTLDPDAAFVAGNECYHAEKYPEAEAYYRLAIDGLETQAGEYVYFEIANNLVLAMLQQEKNQEAYDLCMQMLTSRSSPNARSLYGALLNLLVCGHALGMRSAEVMKTVADPSGDWFVNIEILDVLSADEPGTYGTLVTALVYNMVYMDMEGDIEGLRASFPYYPSMNLEDTDLKNVKEQMTEDLATLGESPSELLSYLLFVLTTAQEYSMTVYGEEDPDIAELLSYIMDVI